MTREEHKICAG